MQSVSRAESEVDGVKPLGSRRLRVQAFLQRHSLVIGIILIFIYTWSIDLSNSGVLPFKLPFAVGLTVGWGFVFVSLLMTWLTLGKDETVALFKRFFLWRVDWKWYLVAVLLIPAIRFAAIPLTVWLTGIPANYGQPMIREVVPLEWPLLAMVIPWILFEIFTNGEEMGWRGYVLPRLQAKYSAAVSSLILGMIWSVWHLPKFLGTGLNQERSFFWFTAATLSLAILYTWLYNSTRGSLLLVTLFHASSNTAGMFLPAQFTVKGGIVANLETVLLAVAAIAVTAAAGAEHLSRTEEKQMQETNNQPGTAKSMLVVLAIAALVFVGLPANVQASRLTPVKSLPATASAGLGPTDPADLEVFLDDLMARDMEEHHIAGATVSVVKDGTVFFAKGYGFADLEHNIPVDPDLTLFRIGSVTKLFTWTAVMQLVEQGKLDLEADVNQYLDFRIPETYPQPITLKHLMNHTAGFEDLYFEFASLEELNQPPPGEYLASHIPGRVRPPGEVAAYSNYGAALAGYIVSRVSGQPYDQYIQEHIFDPLGMTQSRVIAGLDPDVAEYRSVGYAYQDGTLQVFPKLYAPLDLAPMGFMESSATDMARFMIMHLQAGFYGDASSEIRILDEATAEQMHQTLYTPDERILGTAYGFFDFSDNGQWTIGHSGEAEPMSSLLLLLPDQDLGVFVAYNSLEGAGLTTQHLEFQRAFFDHYFPAPALDAIQPPEDFTRRAGKFVGSYRMTRSAYTTLEKFMGFLGAVNVEVMDPGDGTLILASPWGDWVFVEEEPLYFRQVDAPFHILFQEDSRGRITNLYTDYTPQFGFEKLNWYETTGFNMALFFGSTLIFVSMIIVAITRGLRARSTGGGQEPPPRGSHRAMGILLAVSVLNVLFVLGMFLWNNPRPVFGVAPAFQVVLGLGAVSALLSVGALVSAVLAWRRGYWGAAFRSYYSFVTIAAVAFVWFLNQWNLLGWRF